MARLESDPPTHKPGSEAAAYEALRLIRENPEHPDLARWVLELVDPASLIDRSLLEGITTAADLAAEPVPDRQWLVDTLLPSRGLSVVLRLPRRGQVYRAPKPRRDRRPHIGLLDGTADAARRARGLLGAGRIRP